MTLDSRLRLALIAALLGAYLLVYVPEPHSSDGQALLAVGATFLRRGSPDMNVNAHIDWGLPPLARMGQTGVDGARYAKKGPTPSLIMLPLIAAAEVLPWLTTRAAALLFNPLVTALTAALLFTLIRRLGYRPAVALITALIYGLATTALVYTQTLFGEPLAALLILAALLSLHRWTASRSQRDLIVGGIGLALLVGVNTIYALVAPVAAIYVAAVSRRPLRSILPPLVALAAPLIVGLGLLALYNVARFGDPLTSGYNFAEGEGFTTPLGFGLYGLLIGPYRGLLWYSPVVILALPGWLMLRRHISAFAWLILALIGLQILAFAMWWSWHGGVTWGPRFLIPALPLIAVCIAPLIALAVRRRALLIPVLALTALSCGVQILGALYSYLPYIGVLYAHYSAADFASAAANFAPQVYTDPGLSAIAGHWRALATDQPLYPAWLADGVDPLTLGAGLILIIGGVSAGIKRLPRPRLIVPPLIVAALSLAAARHPNPAITALAAALDPPGTVVAATVGVGAGLGDLPTQARVITLHAPIPPDDPLAAPLWDYGRDGTASLWLVTWFGPGAPANWLARDLWASAAFVNERAAADHRALHFDLRPGPPLDHAGGWRFGPITLAGYGVAVEADAVRLTVGWSVESAVAVDYRWFIHLIAADGAIIAQQDRAPQGGYAPTTAWPPGAHVTDRLTFPIPAGADRSGWALRIGWVHPLSGERLAVTAPPDHAGAATAGDGFIRLPAQ
ncbi:MAG: hypothetical protein GYB67_15970 [Chloroflexi bacterium]|nr:hypothetical protein [Chloroflexota bacterium]